MDSYGFFRKLPRELRDSVYDLLVQEVDVTDGGLHFHTRTIVPNLRLISRQFKLEYDERCARDRDNYKLAVTDKMTYGRCGCELRHLYGLDNPQFPAIARHTADLTAILSVCNGRHIHAICSAGCRLANHRRWIDSLSQYLPHLREIHVQLDVSSISCLAAALAYSVQYLASLPKVIELKIIALEPTACSENASAPLAIWTEQHGLQRNEEAILQYLARPSA